MEPNFRPKPPCKCPKLAKLTDKQITKDINKPKALTSDNRQTTNDNIPSTVRKMQSQAQKQSRPLQIHRKIDQKSDWSNLDNSKDNQASSIVIDITSDQEVNIDSQPSTSNPSTSAPLRRPITYPKGLSLGRGRGNFPLDNWTSVAKGSGCRFINGCDIPQTPPVHQEPVERNLAVVASTDRVQTNEGNLAPSTARKDLANWSRVRHSNTRAGLTNNNNNRMEQR